MMHTSNSNSGTKKITEATATMNLNSSTTVSLPTTTNTKTATATEGGGGEEKEGRGGGGGKSHVGSGENIPNNNTSRNKRVGGPELSAVIHNPTYQDRDRRAAAKEVLKSSSTENDDDNHNDDNTENITEKNTHTTKKDEAVGDCGQRVVLGNSYSYEPSPPSSVKTLSEVVKVELAAAEIRCEREKCPICFHVLPRSEEVEYKSCCGRKICYGCSVGRERAGLREPGKIIEGETLGEDWFAPLSDYSPCMIVLKRGTIIL